MTNPAPRPALRKAPDAHIHPAAPQEPRLLRHASTAEPAEPTTAQPTAAEPTAAEQATVAGIRSSSPLSGPPGGTTSDSLRRAGKRGRSRPPGKESGKKVALTVQIPKSLRKEFRAAIKADRQSADAVVATLLRSWLDG